MKKIGTGKTYFDKIIKLIEILNEKKDENGISRITRNQLEKELNIGTTSLNKMIRDINEQENVIKRFNEWYIINVKHITDIKKYNKMFEIMNIIVHDINLMNKNEIEFAKEYNIERKTLQKIKTVLRTW